jgi:hypothetical protein
VAPLSAQPDLLLAEFAAAADAAAAARPEVDRDLARELMQEAATVLHNGLALDDLDDHDYRLVVASLAAALTDPDPTGAVLLAADRVAAEPAFHDPDAASAAHLVAASVLRL